MHANGITLKNTGKLIFQWSEAWLSCLGRSNTELVTLACRTLFVPVSGACCLSRLTQSESHWILLMSIIIAYNQSLVVVILLTQITIEINTVFGMLQEQSAIAQSKEGGYSWQAQILPVDLCSCRRTAEENTFHKYSINWFIGKNGAPQSQGLKGLCKQLSVFGVICAFGFSFSYGAKITRIKKKRKTCTLCCFQCQSVAPWGRTWS